MDVKEAFQKIKDSQHFYTDQRRDRIMDFRYYAGHQWEDEDREYMEERKRPAVAFNQIAKAVNAVTGLENNNRQEVQYIPRELGDVKINEMWTESARYVRDKCDACDEQSEAFQDVVIGGLGCTQTYMFYEENPDGDLIEERICPTQMLWDMNSTKRNLDDARWIARVKQVSYQEAVDTWGEDKVSHMKAGEFFYDGGDTEIHNAQEAHRYENNQSSSDSKHTYPIIHLEWFERGTIWRYTDDQGNIITIDKAEADKEIFIPNDDESTSKISYKEALRRSGKKLVSIPQRVYKHMTFSGEVVLNAEERITANEFTYKCMTGMRDVANNDFFGLVRVMRDPQMWFNKWLSTIIYTVGTNSKGGLIAEKGAFADPGQAEDQWSDPDSITYVNDGFFDRVREKGQSPYPQGMDRMMQISSEMMSKVTGLTDEFVGGADGFQAASLEDLRKESTIALLGWCFSSLSSFKKRQGSLLAKMMNQNLTDGRLMRVTGQDGEQFTPLEKKESLEFDVIVDHAAMSANQKNKTFRTLMALLPAMTELGNPPPIDALDYAPLPASLIEKWKEQAQPKEDDGQAELEQQLQQIQFQQLQLDMERLKEEIEETKSKTVLNYAKAEKEMAVSKDETAQAMVKMGVEMEESESRKDEQLQREQARADRAFELEQQRKQIEFQLDQTRKNREINNG